MYVQENVLQFSKIHVVGCGGICAVTRPRCTQPQGCPIRLAEDVMNRDQEKEEMTGHDRIEKQSKKMMSNRGVK
jgi:hypothetical protein